MKFKLIDVQYLTNWVFKFYEIIIFILYFMIFYTFESIFKYVFSAIYRYRCIILDEENIIHKTIKLIILSNIFV